MSDDPVSDEIQELAAKPVLTEAESIRLQLLMLGQPRPRRWGWLARWIHRRQP